jgi:hypothetical protein
MVQRIATGRPPAHVAAEMGVARTHGATPGIGGHSPVSRVHDAVGQYRCGSVHRGPDGYLVPAPSGQDENS